MRFVDLTLDLLHAGQHAHHAFQSADRQHLLQLLFQVFEIEGALRQLPGEFFGLVAINLLARLTRDGMLTKYVSRNAAPREVYKERLAGHLRRRSRCVQRRVRRSPFRCPKLRPLRHGVRHGSGVPGGRLLVPEWARGVRRDVHGHVVRSPKLRELR